MPSRPTEVPAEHVGGAPAAVRPDRAHAGVRAAAAHHAARGAQPPLLQQAAAAPEARWVITYTDSLYCTTFL